MDKQRLQLKMHPLDIEKLRITALIEDCSIADLVVYCFDYAEHKGLLSQAARLRVTENLKRKGDETK